MESSSDLFCLTCHGIVREKVTLGYETTVVCTKTTVAKKTKTKQKQMQYYTSVTLLLDYLKSTVAACRRRMYTCVCISGIYDQLLRSFQSKSLSPAHTHTYPEPLVCPPAHFLCSLWCFRWGETVPAPSLCFPVGSCLPASVRAAVSPLYSALHCTTLCQASMQDHELHTHLH